MDSHQPKVSIVIPVYNGSNYVKQAIESALAQTYRNLEILVINDGSNDVGATERIVKSFGAHVRYFMKENGGVSSALNFGIEKMEGDFFSWLSHDDIYDPRKIEHEVDAIKDKGPCAIAYSDYYLIDENSNRFELRSLPDVPPGGMRCYLTESTAIHGCTLLIPRESLLKAGGFSTTLKTTQDQDLWFRLASQCQYVHVAAPLVSVRMHTAQDSVTRKSLARQEQEQLYNGFLSELDEKEIKSYCGGDDVSYLLRVYRDFRRMGLRGPAEVTSKKILAALRGERRRIRVLLRLMLASAASARIVWETRVKIYYWLHNNSGNSLVRLILAVRERCRF